MKASYEQIRQKIKGISIAKVQAEKNAKKDFVKRVVETGKEPYILYSFNTKQEYTSPLAMEKGLRDLGVQPELAEQLADEVMASPNKTIYIDY